MVAWQYAESVLIKLVKVGDLFTICQAEQIAKKCQGFISRQLLIRRFVKTFPKGTLGSLFAAAKERPADTAHVILGARESQRQKHYIALTRQIARARGQLRWPIRVVR